MNTLDIVILIPIAFAAVRGFMKGFINEITGLVALVIGVVAAFKLMHIVGEFIHTELGVNSKLIPFFGFLVVFVALVYGINLLGNILDKALKKAALGIFNRLAGAFFGILKASFAVSMGIFLLNKISFISIASAKDSILYDFMANLAPKFLAAIGILLPYAQDLIKDISSFFDRLGQPK